MSQSVPPSDPYQNSDLFSSYYLDERVDRLDGWDCDEEAAEAFERLRDLWELEKDLVESYNESELLDSWIDDVLDILGFGTLSETTLPDGSGYNDRLLFESHEARRDAALRRRDGDAEAMYNLGSALLEAKQWDADFTKRFSEERSYRDASQQTKYYLEHTPERLKWGILTNGKQWRLYGTKDYATETYYEVDLPKLLESGDLERFKYFYTFFQPAAFREIVGESYLDTVWSESETAAQELGEDLQDNVFTALRTLGEGFIDTNDLSLDPDDDEAREQLKEQSLVLLYRLMFVLYAEAEELIHPNEPGAEKQYRENFSLEQLRLEIHEDVRAGESFEDYSRYSTSMWSRLQDLFRLIDRGEDSLGIPPYNGGLFDSERHGFLADNQVSDRYIAEVIYRLATTESEDGSFVLADYADLDTRHLGTIYEGLLEHQFRIAPEQYAAVSDDGAQVWKPATEVSVADAVETVDAGELYVVNDEGERKATGAYYTPDYVVTYIVEGTVGPLIEEIDTELQANGLEPSDREYFAQFWQAVLDLKILDPAMGSGHFLTRATGYLTERVMEVVREQEIQSYDEQDLRRGIAKECIYGVDVNGMAVELAKLSMWLETLAADQPLAFLDHHLKAGNSLVGSDITDVLSSSETDGNKGVVSDDGDSGDGTVQASIFDYFEQVRQQALDHVMDRMGELLSIDNETLEEIHSMEAIYDEVRADPLYVRLQAIATVHTASEFGLDVPEDAIEQMAHAIEDEDEWADIETTDWFRAARAMANEESFFHWELEFPAVFFDGDGERLASAGFDAVVGNPPYVRQEQLSATKDYLSIRYKSYRSAADLYTYFIENAQQLLQIDGKLGYIVSNKFIHAEYGDRLRSSLAEQTKIRQILDFHSLPVFSRSVSAYPLILLSDKTQPSDSHTTTVAKIQSLDFTDLHTEVDKNSHEINQNFFSESRWQIQNQQISAIVNTIEKQSTQLSDYLDAPLYRGILTGLNDAFIINEQDRRAIEPDEEFTRPLLKGQDIHRFKVEYSNRYLIRIPSGWTRQQSGKDSEENAWGWFKNQYPQTADHLSNFKSSAKDRHDRGEFWWELRPCDYYDELDNSKIVYPVISKGPNFAVDTEGYHINDKLYAIPVEDYALLGFLNSTLAYFWIQAELSGLRGGYQEFRAVHVEKIPVRDSVSNNREIAELAEEATELRKSLDNLNLDLLDYLGSYEDGPTLGELNYGPASGLHESVLTDTEADSEFAKLRVTGVQIEHDGDRLRVLAVPYVKPDDPAEYETNSRGYATLDPVPAMDFLDLSDAEADLIEAFVPYAVAEAGGFAGYRDNATKNISPLDRLEALTLPKLADVEDRLNSYTEARDRAAELDERIERTDQLIDEIVYELYGLTDDEIEIVEDAVN